MPDQQSHIAQAEKNERFRGMTASRNPSSDQFTEWEVVALFYSALHYIEAVLDHNFNIHPNSHKERMRLVAMTDTLRPIELNYRNLHNRSMDARYNLLAFTRTQIDVIERDEFQPLKAHVRSLLGLP
jgi:hypothetical protein